MIVPAAVLASVAYLLAYSPLVAAIAPQDIPADTPISSLLSSAQSHLARGETGEALVYFDAAVARDPDDYLTFFKRATTYLSLGRTSQAAQDFTKVLALKPAFEGAHVQLAKIKTRTADWDGALHHYIQAHKSISSPEVVALQEAQNGAISAHDAANHRDWDACVRHASAAISLATRAAGLRELRARCRLERADLEEAVMDLQQLLHLKPQDVTPFLQISAVLFYSMGDLAGGLAQTRKCLQSDQESKPCRKLLKEQQAAQKILTKAEASIAASQPMSGVRMLTGTSEKPGLVATVKAQMEKLEEDGVLPARARQILYSRIIAAVCRGYYDVDNAKKAKLYCEESLALDPNSLYGMLYNGKSLLEKELYEEAIRTFQEAVNRHQDQNAIIAPLLQQAQIALKRSANKDYYKILGVAVDADDRQIKSAYRKLTKQFHPDKAVSQGITQEVAQKKMANINEAYEILRDPELRARFDRGDNPNAPVQQQPFHFGGQNQGGMPFMFQQGGGHHQQFHFKFA